jgi:hypothetical protein
MIMRTVRARSVNLGTGLQRTSCERGRAGLPAFLGALTLCALGCPSVPPPDDGSSLLIPENYRSTFVEVRGCRSSSAHPAMVRVWVNSIGAAAYMADDNPMPVGSIVIKEEFAGTDCSNDADLTLWSIMGKEPAGFDTTGRDWHFQQVTAPDRTIFREGNSTCIACHTAPECTARDLMCTEP